MHRVTITIDDELMAELDEMIAARGYPNRSEAIRDLARAGLQQAQIGAASGQSCVAALVYVYDHAKRQLSERLTHAFHDHHELSVTTLHVHLDVERCLEVAVLKGKPGAVRHFADHVIAERGVHYGQLIVLPAGVGPAGGEHRHIASSSSTVPRGAALRRKSRRDGASKRRPMT